MPQKKRQEVQPTRETQESKSNGSHCLAQKTQDINKLKTESSSPTLSTPYKIRTKFKIQNLEVSNRTMATKSDMKGFYKQKKKGGGITKPSNSKSSFTKKSTTPKNAAAIGSDVTQPPALISHGSLDLQGQIFSL